MPVCAQRSGEDVKCPASSLWKYILSEPVVRLAASNTERCVSTL